MGGTPERERSVPMENVEEVKKKSKRKESRYGKRYGILWMTLPVQGCKVSIHAGLVSSVSSEKRYYNTRNTAPSVLPYHFSMASSSLRRFLDQKHLEPRMPPGFKQLNHILGDLSFGDQ